MADLSDVVTALVNACAAAVYPSGTAQPSAAGVGVRIYGGWPVPEQLDADLRATPAVCHVSVYPRPEERNTTRYSPQWQQTSINTPTLTATISGQQVTIGGAVPPASNPHVVTVLANYRPYVYAVQASDTLASVALALAALIPGASAAGAVLTLPNSTMLTAARVGVTGTVVREIRRQEKQFQIAVWADTPAHRDAIAAAIDPVLAITTFLQLADGSAGRLVYKTSLQSDALQKDRLYRRDLFYTVEYGTTQSAAQQQITQEQLNVSAAVAGVLPYAPVATLYG